MRHGLYFPSPPGEGPAQRPDERSAERIASASTRCSAVRFSSGMGLNRWLCAVDVSDSGLVMSLPCSLRVSGVCPVLSPKYYDVFIDELVGLLEGLQGLVEENRLRRPDACKLP